MWCGPGSRRCRPIQCRWPGRGPFPPIRDHPGSARRRSARQWRWHAPADWWPPRPRRRRRSGCACPPSANACSRPGPGPSARWRRSPGACRSRRPRAGPQWPAVRGSRGFGSRSGHCVPASAAASCSRLKSASEATGGFSRYRSAWGRAVSAQRCVRLDGRGHDDEVQCRGCRQELVKVAEDRSLRRKGARCRRIWIRNGHEGRRRRVPAAVQGCGGGGSRSRGPRRVPPWPLFEWGVCVLPGRARTGCPWLSSSVPGTGFDVGVCSGNRRAVALDG